MPVISDIATEKMTDLHVRIFSERADPDCRGEHEGHMAAFFECTLDTCLVAFDAGFPEAEAREVTYVQASFDFYNHGWVEMMGILVDEIKAYHECHEEFFERRGIDIVEPLDEFRTIDIPGAPTTLDKLDDPDHPHAKGGFADDVYVKDDSGKVGVGGAGGSENANVPAVPGMQGVDRTDKRTA